MARRGTAWLGGARQGKVNPPQVLTGLWRGLKVSAAWPGKAWLGTAGRGMDGGGWC